MAGLSMGRIGNRMAEDIKNKPKKNSHSKLWKRRGTRWLQAETPGLEEAGFNAVSYVSKYSTQVERPFTLVG
jgi:hypothetical protein